MAAGPNVEQSIVPLKSIDSIDGLVVFGSTTRDELHETSDVDVLVIYRTSSNVASVRAKVKDRIPRTMHRVSVSYFTANTLTREINARPSFGAHLADEAVFVYCKDSCTKIRHWIKGGWSPPARDLEIELEREVASLALFSDTARFNEDFVPSLGRLYSIARSVLIIKLLQSGIHEYSWRRIFGEFANLYPEFGESLRDLAGLRRYYEFLIDRRSTLPEEREQANAARVTRSIRTISAIASVEPSETRAE